MKAGEETGDGRLAAAGLADERHGLARLDAQRDIVEHRPIGFVTERDPVEFDRAVDGGKVGGVGCLRDGGFGAEQLAKLDDCSTTLLVAVVELDQGLDRGEERREEEQERGEFAHGDPPARRHGTADGQQGRLGGDADHLGAGGVQRIGAARVDLGIEVFADDRSVVDEVAGPTVVGGDDTNAGERLLQMREQIGDAVAHPEVADR